MKKEEGEIAVTALPLRNLRLPLGPSSPKTGYSAHPSPLDFPAVCLEDYLFGGIICIYDVGRGCMYLGFIYMGINMYLGVYLYMWGNKYIFAGLYIWEYVYFVRAMCLGIHIYYVCGNTHIIYIYFGELYMWEYISV